MKQSLFRSIRRKLLDEEREVRGTEALRSEEQNTLQPGMPLLVLSHGGERHEVHCMRVLVLCYREDQLREEDLVVSCATALADDQGHLLGRGTEEVPLARCLGFVGEVPRIRCRYRPY